MILTPLRLLDPSFFEKVRTFWTQWSGGDSKTLFQTTVEILRAVFARKGVAKRPSQPANMGR